MNMRLDATRRLLREAEATAKSNLEDFKRAAARAQTMEAERDAAIKEQRRLKGELYKAQERNEALLYALVLARSQTRALADGAIANRDLDFAFIDGQWRVVKPDSVAVAR